MTKLTRNSNLPATISKSPSSVQDPSSKTIPLDPISRNELAVSERDFVTKLGPNDKPVEIWFDNDWKPAFMSRVRTGDFYRFLDMTQYGYKAGACFLCKEAPMVDYRYSSTNPTIHMGVAEIQQAAPTVDRTPRLRGATKVYTAIDDAGFMEKPKLPALPSLDDLIADDGVVTDTRTQRSGRFDDDDSVEDVDFKE